jgi:hypothetical protein
VDAGYPASDEALRQVTAMPQCAWVSVTNGDNAYGSEVVQSVLQLRGEQKKDLVLMPMDSRNFANEGANFQLCAISHANSACQPSFYLC